MIPPTNATKAGKKNITKLKLLINSDGIVDASAYREASYPTKTKTKPTMVAENAPCDFMMNLSIALITASMPFPVLYRLYVIHSISNIWTGMNIAAVDPSDSPSNIKNRTMLGTVNRLIIQSVVKKITSSIIDITYAFTGPVLDINLFDITVPINEEIIIVKPTNIEFLAKFSGPNAYFV